MSFLERLDKEELLLHSNPLTKEDFLRYIILGNSPVLCRVHKESSYSYAPLRFVSGEPELFFEASSQWRQCKELEFSGLNTYGDELFINNTLKRCDVFIHPEQEKFK